MMVVAPAAPAAPSAAVAAAPVAATSTPPPAARVRWSTLLPGLYLAGVLLLLARIAAERLSLRRLDRGATEVVDPLWIGLVVACAARIGVRRPVRLLRSDTQTMPMAFGIRRAAIVLPAVADTWTEDRRRAVLLHELAHVARHDCLTQMLAAVTCACYWVHPGVWWAARQLRVERELACDDRVITAGTDARDYAGHLLDLAYSLGSRRTTTLALPMAGRRQLEGRLRAAMDAARNRATPARRSRRAALALLALLLMTVAAATATVVPVNGDPSPGSIASDMALDEPATANAPVPPPDVPGPGQVSVSTPVSRPAAPGGQLQWRGDYIQWSGRLAEGQTVQLRGLHGSIRATNSDDGMVYVEGHRVDGDEVPIVVEQDGRGVRLCVDDCQSARGSRSWFFHGRADDAAIDFLVRVPAGVRFDGATVDGVVDVEGLRSEVHVATVQADVRIQKAIGFAAHATTVSGNVIVDVPAGDNTNVHATTVGGAIESDFALNLPEPPPRPRGVFDLNGPVRLTGVPGTPVSATIGTGGPGIHVTTVSGSISVRRQ
jgi:beta-lactamase regulating signal transducer with metallopeptidase domain